MVEFKDIPNMVIVLISVIIILVIGVLLFTAIGDSGVLTVETWSNDTVTAGANATSDTGFIVGFSFDNIVSIDYITLANDSDTSYPNTLTSDNYTLNAAEGYIDVIGLTDTAGQFAGQSLNISGTYYNDTILDLGTAALQTFGSWLGIMVVILLAGIIFGLFKYFGAGAEGSAY